MFLQLTRALCVLITAERALKERHHLRPPCKWAMPGKIACVRDVFPGVSRRPWRFHAERPSLALSSAILREIRGKTEIKSGNVTLATARMPKGLKITMSVNYSPSLRIFLPRESHGSPSGNVYCSFSWSFCFLVPESIKVWQYTYATPHVQNVSRARTVRACRPFVPFFSIWICARVLAGPFLLIWYFLRLYPDIFMANLLRVLPCAHVLIASANQSWKVVCPRRKEIFQE